MWMLINVDCNHCIIIVLHFTTTNPQTIPPPNIMDPRRCEDVDKVANISIGEGNRNSLNLQTKTPTVLISNHLLFSFTEIYKFACFLIPTCSVCHRRAALEAFSHHLLMFANGEEAMCYANQNLYNFIFYFSQIKPIKSVHYRSRDLRSQHLSN